MTTSRYDGIDLATLAAISTASTTVYVATTGSDTNAGTQAAPKLTLAGALALMPPLLAAPFLIHCAAGTYTWTPPKANDLSAAGLIGVIGDDVTVVATGALTTGSTTTALQLAVATTANSYQAFTLEMTSGTYSGQKRTVRTNSTVQLDLVAPLGGVPASGDTYRITRPAVTIGAINVLGTNVPPCLGTDAPVAFVNCTFSSGSELIGSVGQPLLLFGCEQTSNTYFAPGPGTFTGIGKWRGGGFPQLLANSPYAGWVLALQAAAGIATPSGLLWEGWGHSFAWLLYSEPTDRFEGYLTSPTGIHDTTGGPGSQLILWGGTCRALRLSSGRVSFPGTTEFYVLAATGQAACKCDGTLVLDCVAPLKFDNVGGAFPVLDMSGQARLSVGSLALTSSTSTAKMQILEASSLKCSALNIAGPNNGSSINTIGGCDLGAVTSALPLTIGGASTVQIASLSATTLIVTGSARVCVAGSIAISGASSVAVVQVAEGGALVLENAGASKSAANTLTTAGIAAVRCQDAGTLVCVGNMTTSIAAASGYGVNCRGGGRFLCTVQPTSVSGPTADFTVGTSTGDDFSNSALASSYATRSAGAAVVGRTT